MLVGWEALSVDHKPTQARGAWDGVGGWHRTCSVLLVLLSWYCYSTE